MVIVIDSHDTTRAFGFRHGPFQAAFVLETEGSFRPVLYWTRLMIPNVQIVNYHYVRPIKKGLYPGIKGREVEEFEDQANYLKRNFNLIGMDDLGRYLAAEEQVPEKAAMMTFDDGYADHYEYVFPILNSLGIKGAFFIPVKVVAEERMLEVNMIQLILATADIDAIIAEIRYQIENDRSGQVSPWEHYYKTLAKPGRFDGPKVTLVKKLLQNGLPAEMRTALIDHLWLKWLRQDEKEVAMTWYLTKKEIREMSQAGMYIGNHTYSHEWLDGKDMDGQKKDIIRAQAWLDEIIAEEQPRTLCYPYGRFDLVTKVILRNENFVAAFTTEGKIFDVAPEKKYDIPRLDTNQVPVNAPAAMPAVSFAQ